MPLRNQRVRYVLLSLVAATGSAVLLFLLYRDLDFAGFWRSLKGANVGWLVVLFVAIPVEQVVRAWKWRQLLYDLKPIKTSRFFAAVMAGYAVTSVVPFGVSPLVRSWLVARLENLRTATLLASAALERTVDGVVFGFLVAGFALFGTVPAVEGQLRTGFAVAAAGSLVVFAALAVVMFAARRQLANPASAPTRLLSRLAARFPRLQGVHTALAEGVVYPRSRWRQIGVVLAAVVMKLTALSNFLWAGLALGVHLSLNAYLFVLIFVSFAVILSRFVKLPGGFVLASGYALRLVGVDDETALAMILFVTVISLVATLSIGLTSLYASGLTLAELRDLEKS